MAAAMAVSAVSPAYAEELSSADVVIVDAGDDAMIVDEPASTQEQAEGTVVEPDIEVEAEAGAEDAPDITEDVIISDIEDGGSVEPDDEIIIENVEDESVTGDEVFIEIPEEDLIGMEIELDEEIGLAEAGTAEDAANLSAARKRRLGSGLYAGMEGSVYTNSYGGELLGNYATVYQESYKHFVTAESMDEAVISLSDAILFTVDISDPSKGVTSADITASEDYKKNVIPEIKAIGQAANDAIAYDCPEVFWINNFTIGVKSATPVTINEDRTQAICGISKITMNAKERFEDAYDSRETFKENVYNAYVSLSAKLNGKTECEIVKGIHDYICVNAAYGQNNGAEVSHTAAGFFLFNDKYVVCDGYAKALQVLCNKFGIKSVLIAGDVIRSSGDTEAHAWNYVLLDGAYYLVDATWDDAGSTADTTYLLKGWDSIGSSGKAISEERREYNAFSSTEYSSTFARPLLSSDEYHYWGEGSVEKEPTCSAEGLKKYTCSICGETKDEPISTTEHTWESTETVDKEPTCEEAGSKSIHCSFCGASKEGSEVPIPAKTHAWDDGTVIKEATCTETGTMKYVCGNCKKEKTEDIQMIPHKWESTAREDEKATCISQGSKSIHCSVCGQSDESSKEPRKVPAHPHRHRNELEIWRS